MRIRVIPSLLIHKGGLVKSVQFKNYKYVGDPINAVKIFNEKEVDEIALIDIDATRENRPPNIQAISEIASEAFMPMSYGGGVTTFEQAKSILLNGFEKVVINKSLHTNLNLVTQIANVTGSQSVVASIDVKKNLFGNYKVFIDNGKTNTGLSPIEFAKKMEEAGAGEIILNNIDRDGTYKGYDIELLNKVTKSLKIPVVICGGASSENDFHLAIQNGASAVAAGSMFVFQRPHQAVLISYPTIKKYRKND